MDERGAGSRVSPAVFGGRRRVTLVAFLLALSWCGATVDREARAAVAPLKVAEGVWDAALPDGGVVRFVVRGRTVRSLRWTSKSCRNESLQTNDYPGTIAFRADGTWITPIGRFTSATRATISFRRLGDQTGCDLRSRAVARHVPRPVRVVPGTYLGTAANGTALSATVAGSGRVSFGVQGGFGCREPRGGVPPFSAAALIRPSTGTIFISTDIRTGGGSVPDYIKRELVDARISGATITGSYQVGAPPDRLQPQCVNGPPVPFTLTREGAVPPLPVEPIPPVGQSFTPVDPTLAAPACATKVTAPPIEAVSRCFIKEGELWVSPVRVRVNGIDVIPAEPGAEVVIDPRVAAISSRGAVEIRVGPVFLTRGEITREVPLRNNTVLDVGIGPRFFLDDGNLLGGLLVRGSVEIVFDAPGSTTATFSVTTDFPFPGTSGTVTVNATNDAGLVLDKAKLYIEQVVLGAVEARDLTLIYTRQPSGAHHWDGSGTFYVPMPGGGASRCIGQVNLSPTRISGFRQIGISLTAGFGLGDDYFRMGAGVDGVNCYLAYGIFLQRIAIAGQLGPVGATLSAGVTFGPQVNVPVVGPIAAASLDGTATTILGDDWRYRFDGVLKVVNGSSGKGYVDISGDGVKSGGEVTIQPVPLVPAGIQGQLDGWFDSDQFNMEGEAKIVLPLTQGTGGEAVVSSVGVAGCRRGFGPDVGFGYRWGELEVAIFNSSCGLGPFTAYDEPGQLRSSAGGAGATGATFDVPSGRSVAVFAARGTTAPPIVTVTGPGEQFTTSPTSAVETATVLAIPVPSTRTTYIAIDKPRRGRWTVVPAPGSPPIEAMLSAEPRAAVRITGRVVRTGTRNRLVYRASGLAKGGRIVFFQDRRQLAVARRAQGTIALPASADPGRRTIRAAVIYDGFPAQSVLVARYRPQQAKRPPKPRGLRVVKVADGREIRWQGPPGRYRVTAVLSDGRRLNWSTNRRRIRVRPLGPNNRVRVTVRQVDERGRAGPPARAQG